jgi:iron complex transport system substrate-binding protein
MPQVGYARTLSAEGVLALKPQLLLASGEAGPPQVLAQLRSAGVQVEVLDEQHRFDGVLARTQRIGALCGRRREAVQLAAQLQQDWGARPKPPAGPVPRVLFVLAHAGGQLRVAGEGTAADAMIVLAGARNAFAGVQGYRPLTAEAALQAAPDVILCTAQGLQAQGDTDGLLKAPGLALTPAGRSRRVVGMEAMLLLGFGPRLPQAVAELTGHLHGHGHGRAA